MIKPKNELKYVVCLFKMEGHETYRAIIGGDEVQCDNQLKTQLGQNVVTSKKFFEINRLTGTFEEF